MGRRAGRLGRCPLVVTEELLRADRALSVGLVDQAEQLYRKVADDDPANAVAVVGIARVLLERGDEAGAYEQVTRALELEPTLQPALRMEARLSEILAARGRPVERPAFVQPGGRADRAPRSSANERARGGVLRRFLGGHRDSASGQDGG